MVLSEVDTLLKLWLVCVSSWTLVSPSKMMEKILNPKNRDCNMARNHEASQKEDRDLTLCFVLY